MLKRQAENTPNPLALTDLLQNLLGSESGARKREIFPRPKGMMGRSAITLRQDLEKPLLEDHLRHSIKASIQELIQHRLGSTAVVVKPSLQNITTIEHGCRGIGNDLLQFLQISV